MDNELLLLSGLDIPFIEAQITIHQPTIKEVSLIGEETFFTACKMLNFSKDSLNDNDKNILQDKTNFEIILYLLNQKGQAEIKNKVLMLLSLVFPDYKINITENEILFISNSNSTRINNLNFDIFKNILNSMFIFDEHDKSNSKDYNPTDGKAAKIAEKFKKRKSNKNSEETQKVAIFSRYISILSIGLQKDMNNLMNYTVFQLKDEFNRFQKKIAWDINFKCKLAGATDLEEVEDWMMNIHSS